MWRPPPQFAQAATTAANVFAYDYDEVCMSIHAHTDGKLKLIRFPSNVVTCRRCDVTVIQL